MRLDQYLFQQGHVPSRERARALVMSGIVYLNGQRAEKPGQNVPDGAQVEVRGSDIPYVSRGGLKLEKALQVFDLTPQGLTCMDVGASTGGFTDCLLQNGAARVYAVDVGYGQLAWRLRSDPRVVVMERCNIRKIETLPETIVFFTIDVSFISLKLVLPVLYLLTAPGCNGICLVKPQFEAGKDKVGKNGVVRDPATHLEVLNNTASYANSSGYSVLNIDYSPIKGPKGNIEFLMHLQKADAPTRPDEDNMRHVCEAAAKQLEGDAP
ncbi:MAG: TlyA family RNA methyltransferase [Ruminococcaceae bacterium]|nr:TlyA family RNA methyltransferase [Oscillospiraceae bacterium]